MGRREIFVTYIDDVEHSDFGKYQLAYRREGDYDDFDGGFIQLRDDAYVDILDTAPELVLAVAEIVYRDKQNCTFTLGTLGPSSGTNQQLGSDNISILEGLCGLTEGRVISDYVHPLSDNKLTQ